MSRASHDAGFLREVVLDSAGGIAAVDAEGVVAFANESAGEMAGRSRRDLVGRRADALFADGTDTVERAREVAGRPVAATVLRPDGGEVPVALTAAETEWDGETYVTLTLARADGANAPDGSDVERREDVPSRDHSRLVALEEVRRRVAAADDAEAVAENCVAALADVLGYDLCCLRLRTDGNALETAAMTPEARRLVEANPGFEFALSGAGRAYRTGDPVVRRDGSEAAVSDLLASTAHYPVGDHGVLTVGTDGGRTLGPERLDALGFLVAGLEHTLDRIDRERRLRDQLAGLEATADVAAFTYEVISDLLTAESREEVETLACRQLAATDACDGAWIADVDAAGERLEVSRSAGVPEETVAAVEDEPAPDLLDGALETDGPTGTRVLEPSELFGPGGGSDELDGVERVCTVPVATDRRVFGVLAVHVTDASILEGVGERSLAVLGVAIGFALDSLENERLLLSDETVLLEFQVTDPDCLAVALSAELDTYVSMRRTVRNAHDEHLSYVRIEDTAADAALEVAGSLDGVRDCRTITESGDDCLIEVTRPSSGAEVMMEFGATMRTAEAESGRGTLEIEAPQTVDVRRIAEGYQAYNPQSELLSKRRVDRPVRTAEQLRADIENRLTDKQRSAVTSAFFSGYYEWPRESTAEEVADSMGITASTLHQHLRRAHYKILTSLLGTSFSRRL